MTTSANSLNSARTTGCPQGGSSAMTRCGASFDARLDASLHARIAAAVVLCDIPVFE